MKFIKKIAFILTTLVSLTILAGCGESVDGKYARLETDYEGLTFLHELEIKDSDVALHVYNQENYSPSPLKGTLNGKKTKIAWDSEKNENIEFFEDRVLVEDNTTYYKENSTKYKKLQKEWKDYISSIEEVTEETIEETTEETVNETAKLHTTLSEEQALEIAKKVAADFKENIQGTFSDVDTSSSWGSTISITFNEDNSIQMTESDESFLKTDIKYEGEYDIDIADIATEILNSVDSVNPEDKSQKIKDALDIETYTDYSSFLNEDYLARIKLKIDTVANGYSGEEINNKKNSTEVDFTYKNLTLNMTNNRLFTKARQVSLTKE